MADLYTIWANKEGDITDLDWVNGMKSFFDHLISEGKMESYRITRCKMGFRSIAGMPEWMILMEFTGMAQMDSAFKRVAPLEGELEGGRGGRVALRGGPAPHEVTHEGRLERLVD